LYKDFSRWKSRKMWNSCVVQLCNLVLSLVSVQKRWESILWIPISSNLTNSFQFSDRSLSLVPKVPCLLGDISDLRNFKHV
jgi:hypothetical protein